MSRTRLVVAALLLTFLADVAAAAENPKHQSKNAGKTLVLLAAMGIDSAEVVDFVEYIDRRVDNGKIHIAEETVLGGKLSFGYRLEDKIGVKQFELRFTPSDRSNWAATATTEGVLVNYNIKF